jgi:hypothetical protein
MDAHIQCNASPRQIFGKVEVTYSDPTRDETTEITTSDDTAYGTSLAQTADNISGAVYPWFEIGASLLDGTIHPTPDPEVGSVGWWSHTKSDESGEFDPAITLTVEISARPIYDLKVIGDPILEGYPVDFTVKLYDGEDALLHTETVTGNDSYSWYKKITEIEDVEKIVLSVTKINVADSPIRITEFYTAYVETYLGDDLMSIHLLEELDYKSGTIPLGNISSNELVVRFNNQSRKFDPDNPSSPIRNLMQKNRRIKAWLGVELEDEIEWSQLGKFWTQDWNAPDKEVWAETLAYDRLEFLRTTDFKPTTVYEDYSLADLAEIVLLDGGLVLGEYDIDTDLDSVTVPYAFFDSKTHREALKMIAEAGMAYVYCDREGKIIMKKWEVPESSQFIFDMDNTFDIDNPLAWSEIVNYIEVKSNPYRPVASAQTIYEDDDTVTVPAGDTVTLFCMYSENPCVEVATPDFMQSGADIEIQSVTKYSWAAEIIFENTGETDQDVLSVTIEGKPLTRTGGKLAVAQDETSIRSNGKITLSQAIDNPFVQTYAAAKVIADALLAIYKDPRRDTVLDCRGNIALILGDRVTAPAYRDVAVNDYIIVRQELEWDGGLRASVTAQKIVED